MSSDAALATRAVAGDGAAFAELYELYERRTFNLCYRITGSYEDAADATQEAFLGVLRRLPQLEGREVAFGSYVFTAARNACYDLIERRKRSEPSDDLPEAATPIGAGPGGGAPPDPRDPDEDPDRNVLLGAQQEEIRQANQSLPERQREALALRELEELSYDEIAEIMGMNRNSVAQLISRARIGLRDALRGTALHSIAPSSIDCERGLPLLAMAQDGQLEAGSADSGWLADHLAACDTCRLSQEAMQEAGASYRAWVPIAAAPWLFRETVAEAAELVGADWTEVAAERDRRRPRHPIRRLLIAAALAMVVLLAGLATTLRDQAPTPEVTVPAAEETRAAEPAKATRPDRKAPPKGEDAPAPSAPDAPAAEQVVAPAETGTPAGKGTREASVDREREASSDPDTEITPTTPDPPPAEPPPTEPPPTDPPPTDPPTSDPPTSDPPTVCFDANGRPIPCPPRR